MLNTLLIREQSVSFPVEGSFSNKLNFNYCSTDSSVFSSTSNTLEFMSKHCLWNHCSQSTDLTIFYHDLQALLQILQGNLGDWGLGLDDNHLILT